MRTQSERFRPKPSFLILHISLLFGLTAGCGGSSGTQSAAPNPPTPTPTPQIVIQPMTAVSVSAGAGYFPDPYPVLPWISTANPSISQSFTGTTKEILTCSGAIQADCFQQQPLNLDLAPLQAQASADNANINGAENLNTYQDASGGWHMAVTLFVTSITNASEGKWNVIAQARPTVTTSGIPNQWAVDTVLVGSFSQPAPADYDGKYFRDGSNLYLVYSSRLSSQPPEDGIVAQLMVSPTQPGTSAPTPLIGPENQDGGYNSEYLNCPSSPTGSLKLLETGNVTIVNGKYVLAYSDGCYDLPDYKAALA